MAARIYIQVCLWKREKGTPSILNTHRVSSATARDVKDQTEEKANPKPWYTADEKSSKMSSEDLQDLIREYPLPEGWYAHLPGLGEPANYDTKFETSVYEEQVKSGYRLPLHRFAIRFFEHYRMAPGQLVPNGWRKLAEMASGGGKLQQGGFLGVLQKAKGKRKEKQPSVELSPAPKRTRVTPLERSPRILEQVSIEDDPIFRSRWALRRADLGMPDSQVSEQHLRHGVLPRDKEMYTSGSEMLSHFEMARQVAAEEAQLTREAVKEAQEATHCDEELSKHEEDYLAQIATLEKRLAQVKRRAAEEVTKARDQGIPDFLDGNAGDEWLKKRTEDGLEIYELGFVKAN
ncbi:hypothetical protein RJ640_012788 [Escallonia rubra]|uniref:Transposase (putative) gypsy type domain-containing protein n=1 Tax=Escallonia rubra TaxID=112253 RepID=A0AA88UQQ0_9ASTE|nr:hypothetical protein RJ640_012788 [Escallonia rubra]